MKKLIWLMILGVVFFIGGQWLGLVLSEKNRSVGTQQTTDSGASGAQKSAGDRGTQAK